MIIYIVIYYESDGYDGWQNNIKAFYDKERAQEYIDDVILKSMILKDKLDVVDKKYRKDKELIYAKIRQQKATQEEIDKFHKLNKNEVEEEDKLKEESGLEVYILSKNADLYIDTLELVI